MHGHFAWNGPLPKKSKTPEGTTLSLIIDSHTGFIEGRSLGNPTPNLAAVGTVNQLTASTTAVAASARSAVITGKVTGATNVLAGPAGSIVRTNNGSKMTKVIAHAKARKDGSYTLVVRPGTYVIDAEGPPGHVFGFGAARTVTVNAHERVHVDIHYSGPLRASPKHRRR
jgi:hypothetical protein